MSTSPAAETASRPAPPNAWVDDDAPAVDADDDGLFDDAGPTITEALWEPMVLAAIGSVFGGLSNQVYEERELDGSNGASILDKDLRTLLGADVEGPFKLQYCGGGSLETCRAALWEVVDAVAGQLAAQYGDDDPTTWLSEGSLTDFEPGLIPETFRTTNRPTFQQVIEFAPKREDG